MDYPKISIVTINLNYGQYLEEAICSVIGQQYPNLEYIIIDGGSTDNSLEIIRRYENHLSYWVSEPDEGHVYALAKGLQRCTGDIMGWLNSDDRYHPGSLFTVAEIFSRFKNVNWLTGRPSWFTEEGITLNMFNSTARHLVRSGFFSDRMILKWARWSLYRYLSGDFLAIQQESTFWRRSLWEKAGGYIDTNYKIAFDTELWCRFFQYEKLYTTNLMLGGFRYHKSRQQSKLHFERFFEESLRAIQNLKKHHPFYFLHAMPAKCLKPFYYYDIPGMKHLYRWIMRLPDVIYYHPELADYRFRSF